MRDIAKNLSRGTKSFYRWWIDQLSDMLFAALATIAPSVLRPLVVHFRDDQVRISDPADTSKPWLQFTQDGPNCMLPAQLPDVLQQSLRRRRRARVIISTQRALIRTIRLPIAAAPHIESAVRLQLEQLLPIHPSLLAVDLALTDANPCDGALRVELAAIRRTQLDQIVKDVEGWGLSVRTVHLADQWEGPARFEFKPTPNDQSFGSTGTRVQRTLLMAAAALGVICVGIAGAQALRADHALNAAVLDAQPAAKSVLALRKIIDYQKSILLRISMIDSSITAVQLLGEVTTLLPHDAWITNFELKDRNLRLVGLAADSGLVTRVIAGSPQFSSVQLVSSMSAGIGTLRDRFEITAQVRGTSE